MCEIRAKKREKEKKVMKEVNRGKEERKKKVKRENKMLRVSRKASNTYNFLNV